MTDPSSAGPGRPRAVRIASYGGPEVLEIVPMEIPGAGPGEIVVQVRAAGLNPQDTKIREGLRSTAPLRGPVGLGSDASGVVIATGPGVADFAVGDEVFGSGLTGAFATHVVAAGHLLHRKPAGVSFEQAAAIGIPVSTAYQVLRSGGLVAGETLLVHAGSGAVGQAAIQFARLWGATVIATASEPNHARLRELGAVPVAYGAGLLERVQRAAPQGIDVVLDAAGTQEAIDVSLQLGVDPARIIEIVVPGWAAEYGVTVFSGGLPGSVGPAELALRAQALDVVTELLGAGTFELELADRFPLDRVADAMRLSETRHVRGKILLLP